MYDEIGQASDDGFAVGLAVGGALGFLVGMVALAYILLLAGALR